MKILAVTNDSEYGTDGYIIQMSGYEMMSVFEAFMNKVPTFAAGDEIDIKTLRISQYHIKAAAESMKNAADCIAKAIPAIQALVTFGSPTDKE